MLDMDTLVAIVTALATPHEPLVTGAQIMAYCDAAQPPIDYQGGPGRVRAQFEDADNAEAGAGHRLQKFKTSNTWQAAPNAWCLMAHLTAGRQWASQHGWLLVPWEASTGLWSWATAGDPLTTPTVV